MKRFLLVLLALFLLPAAALCGEWEEEPWDWRADWEEEYGDVCRIEDDTLIILDGVTALGGASWYYWDEELEEEIEIEPRFEDGPRLENWGYVDFPVLRVSLPPSLRFLGIESFFDFHFEEFTLPAQLEVLERSALVYCTFDVLRIEAAVSTAELQDALYDSLVSAYEVPENHPLYKTIDGVLFSKDGKTLISYPNNRQAAHYDVPAGVERIERAAFGNEHLQTISLPIGLQSIGDYGFSGCTRLHAIALPLTVREIGQDIFSCCVSLELVSLPENLEVKKDENDDWVKYYPDDTIFRGDNGDTLSGAKSEGWIDAPGRVRPLNQYYAYLYASAEDDVSYKILMKNRIVDMKGYRMGKAEVYEPLTNQSLGWVDLQELEYMPGETLFAYAAIQPKEEMNIWWNHFPSSSSQDPWDPWETRIPLEGKRYSASLFGPYVRFTQAGSNARFGCRIEDATLFREKDETENEYGVVHAARTRNSYIPLLNRPAGKEIKKLASGAVIRPLSSMEGDWILISDGQDTGWVKREYIKPANDTVDQDIPLLDEPDGQTIQMLTGGTQVQILNEEDDWYQVTDGLATGWLRKGCVSIVPELREGE